MSCASTEFSPLKIAFGAAGAALFDPGLPVLAGQGMETLFQNANPAGNQGSLSLFKTTDWLLGIATMPVTAGLEIVTRELYQDMFRAIQGLHLARIWHYIPAINELGPDGLENYQVFCRGRSLAFEQEFGARYKNSVPSASAVGSKSDKLTLFFAASRAKMDHVENPLQIPAYHYPPTYGPRSPSFARATIARGRDALTVFISGTAAIHGHATVAPHDTQQQLECTLLNLSQISQACDLGPNLAATTSTRRHFKIYLRHASDLPAVTATLNQRLLQPGDSVTFLHADICRAQLNIEIEASLIRPATASGE